MVNGCLCWERGALSSEVIENFSVLKDATATALYGARGANGVMLVTTRSGRENERAKINIRVQNSFTSPTEVINGTVNICCLGGSSRIAQYL